MRSQIFKRNYKLIPEKSFAMRKAFFNDTVRGPTPERVAGQRARAYVCENDW